MSEDSAHQKRADEDVPAVDTARRQDRLWPRLSTRSLAQSFVREVIELDQPILATVIGLTIRPGKVCREYVAGYHGRYANPMKYAFFTAALIVLVYATFDISPSETFNNAVGLNQGAVEVTGNATDGAAAQNDGPPTSDPELGDHAAEPAAARPRLNLAPQEISHFIEGYVNYLSFMTLPGVALALWGLLRRVTNLNYAEHLTFVLFVWGHAFLISSILTMLGAFSTKLGLLGVIGMTAVSFAYYTWAAVQFYQLPLGRLLPRMAVLLVVDIVGSSCLGGVVAIVYVIYQILVQVVFA